MQRASLSDMTGADDIRDVLRSAKCCRFRACLLTRLRPLPPRWAKRVLPPPQKGTPAGAAEDGAAPPASPDEPDNPETWCSASGR